MRALITAAVALLALTGCASTAPAAEPTWTPHANVGPCAEFEAGIQTLVSNVTGGKKDQDVDAWHGTLRADVLALDTIAMSATGGVAERMDQLVQDIPLGSITRVALTFTSEAQTFAQNVDVVGNACEQIGYNWTTSIKA